MTSPHSPPSPTSGPAPASSFALFARLWALAGVFHALSFHDWRWWSGHGPLLGIATLAALARPTWPIFALFVGVDVACVGRHLALLPNHILFSWVVNLTLLATLAATLAQRPERREVAARWLRAFAPWLRVEVVVLYFFAAFHKLNAAYFNPDVSCAVTMLHEVAAHLHFLPTNALAEQAVIWGTLLGEVAIPLLLARRPTRLAGWLLGIAFHGLLATHAYVGIYSFTATMLALFVVFVPESFAARLCAPRWWRKALAVAASVAAGFLAIWLLRHRLLPGGALEAFVPERLYRIGMAAALVYGAVSFGAVAWMGKRHGAALREAAPGACGRRSLCLGFPLLLVLIGLQPYLGLRTLMCFSMFSNLQTEGGRTNHLLMPDWLQVTDWQRDLVEVVASDDPALAALAAEKLAVPFLELRRVRTIATGPLTLTFRRRGEVLTFASGDPSTHSAIPPLGPVARQYCRFRAVEADPRAVRCRW